MHGLRNMGVMNQGIDRDAKKYLLATGIPNNSTIYYSGTDQEIDGHHMWLAAHQLFTDCKDANIYSPSWYGYDGSKKIIKTMYPYLGGTASTHKWNACDPRDLDAAFRLTFAGGWTHASTGAKPNGTTGSASTHLVPYTDLTQANAHISYYSRTGGARDSEELMGSRGTSTGNLSIQINDLSNDTYAFFGSTTNNKIVAASPEDGGLYLSSTISTIDFRIFFNGVQYGATDTSTLSSWSYITQPIRLGARSSSGGYAERFTDKEASFSTIGDGLNSSEALSFYNIIQEFQTKLGREV